MQIGSTTSGYSYAPIKSTVGVQTASASTVSTTTAANSQSQVATPKFVNGILTNGSSLLSTDTLSALFEMNDDGTPKINSEAPALQMKKCPSSEVLGQPGCGFSGGLASSGLEI